MVLTIETKYTGFYTKNRGYLCEAPPIRFNQKIIVLL